MSIAWETRAIDDMLARYRYFNECLLREGRLVRCGLDFELAFDYIWDDADPKGTRLAREFRQVVLVLQNVRLISVDNVLPAGILENPDRADWGLTEVALVRPENPSSLLGRLPTSEPYLCHVVVLWETDRRIDVVFASMTVTEDAS